MKIEEISLKLGNEDANTTFIHNRENLNSINLTKLIISKRLSDSVKEFNDNKCLIFDIDSAIDYTLDYDDDYRTAFKDIFKDYTSLLPIGCITLSRPSLEELNEYLRRMELSNRFSIVHTLLFMENNGRIWGCWDDGIYLIAYSVKELIYDFIHKSDITILESYEASPYN